MSPDEPEESFKVTDRRRRDDDAATPGVASAPPNVVPRGEPREPARPTAGSDPALAPPPSDRSLIGLFMMLASSALVALGEAPDPGIGQAVANPQEAAALVDLLVLLREKTEGNRTPEENEVLGELIYDLQLRYINLTKHLAKPRG
jgi:hypothetical protein